MPSLHKERMSRTRHKFGNSSNSPDGWPNPTWSAPTNFHDALKNDSEDDSVESVARSPFKFSFTPTTPWVKSFCCYCKTECDENKCVGCKVEYSHKKCRNDPNNGAFSYGTFLNWLCPKCYKIEREKASLLPPCSGCSRKWEETSKTIPFNCFFCQKKICWDCKADVKNTQSCTVCPNCVKNVNCRICTKDERSFTVFCTGGCKGTYHFKCLGLWEHSDLINWKCLAGCLVNAEARAYNDEPIDRFDVKHCPDTRSALTKNSVAALASGSWDGQPFTVQMIPATFDPTEDQLQFLQTGSVGITDGVSKMVVRLSPEMAIMTRPFGGPLEMFSTILVNECDCEYVAETKLHRKRPVITSLSIVHHWRFSNNNYNMPCLWSGSFRMTTPDQKTLFSKTVHLVSSWECLRRLDEINPVGNWEKHYEVDFIPKEPPTLEGAFDEIIKESMPLKLILDYYEGDKLIAALKSEGMKAFVYFTDPKCQENFLMVLDYSEEQDRIACLIPLQSLVKNLIKRIKAIISGMPKLKELHPQDRLSIETYEKYLQKLQHRLRSPVSPPMLTQEETERRNFKFIPKTKFLDKTEYIDNLEKIELFTKTEYSALTDKYFEDNLCYCLDPEEECLLKILICDHKFTLNPNFAEDREDSNQLRKTGPPRPYTRLNASKGNVHPVIDDEKIEKLRNIFRTSKQSPLLQKHFWEPQSKPVAAIDVLLSLIGHNNHVLLMLRNELMGEESDENDIQAVDHRVRQFVYRQTLNCFDPETADECRWDAVKPWAASALATMLVAPRVPIVNPDRRLVLDYCGRLNHFDNPDVINAFREIGVDPIFADEGEKTLLHCAVLYGLPRVLRETLRLFQESRVSVDTKAASGMTAYFSSITYFSNGKTKWDMCEQLLSFGADPLATDAENQTCLHYAINKGKKKSINYMIDVGYRVIRSRGRGKKGEFVDIKSKLRGGKLTKLLREERVHFRPEWCGKCRKYSDPDIEMGQACKDCFRKSERERKQKEAEEEAKRKASTKTFHAPETEDKTISEDEKEEAKAKAPQPQNEDLGAHSTDSPPPEDKSIPNSSPDDETPPSDAIFCRFEKCIEKDRKVSPREKCYTEAHCSDKCQVVFHRSCFNDFKGDVSVKNLLATDARCMTPDCPGNICLVRTKDFEGNVKTENWGDGEVVKKKKTPPVVTKGEEERGRGRKSGKDKEKKVEKSTSRDNESKGTNDRSETRNQRSSNAEKVGQPIEQTWMPDEVPPLVHIDESQLVELKRPEEDDVLVTGLSAKKKKKKKTKASNDLRYNLYPDSSQSLVIPPASILAPASSVETLNHELTSADFRKCPAKLNEIRDEKALRSTATSAFELEQTGYKLIESLIRTRGGEVTLQTIRKSMENWIDDVKDAFGTADAETILSCDAVNRFRMETKNGDIIVSLNEDNPDGTDEEDQHGSHAMFIEARHSFSEETHREREKKPLIVMPNLTPKATPTAMSSATPSSTLTMKQTTSSVTPTDIPEGAGILNVEPIVIRRPAKNSSPPQRKSQKKNKGLTETQLMMAMMMKMHDMISAQNDELKRLRVEMRNQSHEMKKQAEVQAEVNRKQAEELEKHTKEMKKQNEKIETLERMLRDKSLDRNVSFAPRTEDWDEEEDCSICKEELHSQPTKQLPLCGHIFHSHCFARYKGKDCPLCRKPLLEDFPPLT